MWLFPESEGPPVSVTLFSEPETLYPEVIFILMVKKSNDTNIDGFPSSMFLYPIPKGTQMT